jgi:Capsular polysaccharide biosynthesis protein
MSRKKKYEDYDEEFENDEDEIDLADLIFTLIRRWKLIVLTAIPVVILGVIFAITRPTVYQAETTLIVSNNMSSVSLDSSDISLSQRLVITYSEIAKNKSILNKVINKYDLDTTAEGLAKLVTITPVDSTELISLTYKNSDPQLAAMVTNEIANEFMDKVVQVMRVRNVNVVEKAQVPVQPLPKKRVLILLASVVLGLAAGTGMAFVMEFLHKKLRKPSEIQAILGVSMIGMIPDLENVIAEKDEDSNE